MGEEHSFCKYLHCPVRDKGIHYHLDMHTITFRPPLEPVKKPYEVADTWKNGFRGAFLVLKKLCDDDSLDDKHFRCAIKSVIREQLLSVEMEEKEGAKI